MSTTTDLTKLTINMLSPEQYAGATIAESELYMTKDQGLIYRGDALNNLIDQKTGLMSQIEVIAKDQLKIGDIVYTVNGDTLKYSGPIYMDNGTNSLGAGFNSATFSPDGSNLIIGGREFPTGVVKLYSVSGTILTYISEIYADNDETPLSASYIQTIHFVSSSVFYILGGYSYGIAKRYSLSNNIVTFLGDIPMDGSGTPVNSMVANATFSSDNTKMVLTGYFTGQAAFYTISNGVPTYVTQIYADGGGTPFLYDAEVCSLSTDGTKLIISGGGGTKITRLYTISGSTVTYVKEIYMDNGTTRFNSNIMSIIFYNNNANILISGRFTNGIKNYSISGTTVTYLSDVYRDAGSSLFTYVEGISFYDSGSKLIIAGQYGEGWPLTIITTIYSVSGSTITYVNTIEGVDKTGPLAVSPLNNAFVLSNNNGSANTPPSIYSLSGTNGLYISDINGPFRYTPLDGAVQCILYSPDNSLVIMHINYKVYLFRNKNTKLELITELYSDNNNTPFNSLLQLEFSPDGKLLFTVEWGSARIFSVVGETITFIDYIYKQNGTDLVTDPKKIVVSANSKLLILFSDSSEKANIYSINGTTLTFLSILKVSLLQENFNTTIIDAQFSPLGNYLATSQQTNNSSNLYSVSEETGDIVLLTHFWADGSSTPFSSPYVKKLIFSKDEKFLFAIGEYFIKYYTISGSTITYVADLKDNNNNAFTSSNKPVLGIALNNSKLLITTTATTYPYTHIYNINSDNTVTYNEPLLDEGAHDLYGSITPYSSVQLNNGDVIIGGDFLNYARIYKLEKNAYKLLSRFNITQESLFGFALTDEEINSTTTIQLFDLINLIEASKKFAYTPLPDSNDNQIATTAFVKNAIKPIRIFNKAVTTDSWSADTTYTGYGFRAAIVIFGATSNMIPEVIFAPADADTGNFCSVADSYNGGVYIYTKTAPTATITIPTITLEKVV